jgi:hypothetical protein
MTWNGLERLEHWNGILVGNTLKKNYDSMRVVYIGNMKAKQLPEMQAPKVKDFHDPSHYDAEVEISKDHINSLRMFEGQVYDDRIFQLTTVLTIRKLKEQ